MMTMYSLTLKCRCKQGHEWDVLLANYWFALDNCPTCNQETTEIKAGELIPDKELIKRLKNRPDFL